MSNKKLKAFLDKVEKEFGQEALIIPALGFTLPNEDLEILSTGSRKIDKALGIGGLPMGRIVEILGTESSGKTTLALSVVREAQFKGYRCAYIDTEQALDKVRIKQIGVDFENLAISQPNSAEEALDLLEILVLSKLFKVIVLDSVASLVPKAEIEGDMSSATIGLQARLMGKLLRKVVSPVNKNKVLLIFINQLRNKIGGFTPFPVEVGSGGNALKYYASIRIDMRRTGMARKGEPGSTHKVTIKKNKLAVPMKTTKIKIGEGGIYDE